ncbi:MAG: GH3 auxin-responsive promoter family protein, partial [Candidatus Omnitrophota bacterium]
MSLLYYALKTLTPKVKAFERFTADPVTNQEKLLLEILQRNRETDYGLKYDFSSIKTASEFRARVPLADYETFRPYVEKMTLGEQNILT